jgi:hypothetical protein
MKRLIELLAAVSFLTGCAGLTFGPESMNALTFYDPKPYLFISTTTDCVSTATIISVPETKKGVTFNSGYGTADLSISLSGGMITSVGQKTDTKIPETLNSVATLATAVGGLTRSVTTKPEGTCSPGANLYKIDNGVVNPNPIISIRKS